LRDRRPEDLPRGDGLPDFNVAHAIRVANDGTVYLADRENRRVQMFASDGKFVKQLVRTATPFAAQPRLVARCRAAVPLCRRRKIHRRARPQDARRRGRDRGAGPDRRGPHIATDSKGNIYIAQTAAGLQKLVFKGMSAGGAHAENAHRRKRSNRAESAPL
jgi:hypothetical protein